MRRYPKPHSALPEGNWVATARRALFHWRHLDTVQEAGLIQQAWELDQSRRWEGLDGLVVTSEMRAWISTLACLLTVEVGLRVLTDVTSILVAPTSETRKTVHHLGGRTVGESLACVIGTSLLHGPVRLAWDHVLADQKSWSRSVVIHEFAHKIDMADGVGSGTPPIAGHGQSQRFESAVVTALARVRASEDPHPLSPYAGVNAAELFAVATEAFFLDPDALRERFDELFEVLELFYRQSPLVRFGSQVEPE